MIDWSTVGSYLSVCVGESDSEVGHGPEDGDQGLDGVAVHDGPVLLEVLGCETTLVDDSERKGHTYWLIVVSHEPILGCFSLWPLGGSKI